MSSDSYEVAIIGGGLVGLASALALTSEGSFSLAVLEAEDRLAAHQSGHNSGVIHSGLYYKPGSLKAKNCVEGRKEMYRFCQENGVPYECCGKVVVAVQEHEIPALNELERRGWANGLEGLRRLSPGQIKEQEPHVSAIDGLMVPETGIVDYVQVAQACARIASQQGAAILTGHRVLKVIRKLGEFILETPRGEIRARFLINCGGLHSDRLARMCHLDPGLQIVPFRGEYYELIAARRFLVRNLIYPVPNPLFPFLGVHFTRLVNGGVEAGPNAVLAFKREGYRLPDISLKDCLEMASSLGFWRMAKKYWKTGVGEMYRSLSKSAFVRALQELIPELRADDIQPAGAGVRAQALDIEGNLVDDFRILDAERMIHVLNAPSPAATASLVIGRTIAQMAVKNFDLAKAPVG